MHRSLHLSFYTHSNQWKLVHLPKRIIFFHLLSAAGYSSVLSIAGPSIKSCKIYRQPQGFTSVLWFVRLIEHSSNKIIMWRSKILSFSTATLLLRKFYVAFWHMKPFEVIWEIKRQAFKAAVFHFCFFIRRFIYPRAPENVFALVSNPWSAAIETNFQFKT